MDEKDLLIFLTLADTGNLTRTAEKLYLSQPTLSKRLQNMEADLGAALFLRSKQGVTLTPAGEAAREVIQRTARELNTLREQLQMRKDTICGTHRGLHRLLQIPSAAGSGGLHGSVPGRHPQSLHQPQP